MHPTDLTAGSLPAFAHGLLLATRAKGSFTVLHVDGQEQVHWSELPGVREMLAQWGMIKNAEDMAGLKALGLGVKKVIAKGDSPAGVCIEYLEEHPTDLVVLGTHQDTGWRRWARGQVAEPIARSSGTHSLFIPTQARGFVDLKNGRSNLRKVLIPTATHPRAGSAIEAVRELATMLDMPELQVTLLHVGPETDAPMHQVDLAHGWNVKQEIVQGDVVEQIVARAQALDVDLVAMSTKGHDGFLDMLRGSRTEQVLRRATFALLAVPAISSLK